MTFSIEKNKREKTSTSKRLQTVISSVFLSLSMSLVSGQAISNEEFDFDAQPVYTVKTIPNFANVCQQYVEKKLGLVVGQNFKPNGDDFWIQVGEGIINGPVGGKDYITARMNAYEKALLDSKRNILQAMKVEVGREVAYKTLPAEQKQDLKQSASPEAVSYTHLRAHET